MLDETVVAAGGLVTRKTRRRWHRRFSVLVSSTDLTELKNAQLEEVEKWVVTEVITVFSRDYQQMTLARRANIAEIGADKLITRPKLF